MPVLSKVTNRTTVSDHVYEQLRAALMWGQFEPGQPITIDALAQEFGTSHMPVREALRRLATENGLEVARNGTARVPPVSRTRLDDICRVRAELEGLAAELATAHAGPADIARFLDLARAHEEASRSGDVREMLHRNQILHFAIYELARSEVLSQFIGVLWLRLGPYMRLLTEHVARECERGQVVELSNVHFRIIAAIERRDGATARALVLEDIRVTHGLLQELCPE